jgi:hypothetical protein
MLLAEENKMKFVIVRTDYPMEVHKLDCRDLKGENRIHPWIIEGDTLEAALVSETAIMNEQFESQYKASELFRVMSCAKK